MQKAALLCLLVITSTGLMAQQSKLQLNFSGFRSSKGRLLVSVYNKASGFPASPEAVFAKKIVSLSGLNAETEFLNLPPGTYAVACIHDEDDNGTLTKNFFGIPKEGIGTSNNVKLTFGPPNFKESAFIVQAGESKVLQVSLRYL